MIQLIIITDVSSKNIIVTLFNYIVDITKILQIEIQIKNIEIENDEIEVKNLLKSF